MHRSYDGALLPAIGGPGSGRSSPWHNLKNPSRAMSRFDDLDTRLSHQESTSIALVERANRMRDEVSTSLNVTQGTWEEERHARKMLQEHIHAITDVLRKLSRDVQSLEKQVVTKEQAYSGTRSAVTNLEMHHVAGLTDLRGRVVRCDAAITQLSADLKLCIDSVRSLGQEQQMQNAKVMSRVERVNDRLNAFAMQLEKSEIQNQTKIQHLEGSTSQQVTSVESSTKAMIDQIKFSFENYKLSEAHERMKLEERLQLFVGQTTASWDKKTLQLEKALVSKITELNQKIETTEDAIEKERFRNSAALKSLETDLTKMLDSVLRQQDDEVSRLKRETHEGFITIRDSIENMKKVFDGKRRLLEEQLQRDMRNLQKMVVLI